MKRSVKRALIVVGAVLFTLVAVPVALIASAFVGTSAIQDGVELGSTVRLVKDGFVTIGVIDLGGGKVALIDAGIDKQGKAILAELGRRKLGPEAVQAVLAGGLPERSRDGRHGLIELEPRYCDVAVQRWQEWSGGTGSLEGDRRTFAERTTARGQTNS